MLTYIEMVILQLAYIVCLMYCFIGLFVCLMYIRTDSFKLTCFITGKSTVFFVEQTIQMSLVLFSRRRLVILPSYTHQNEHVNL